MTLRYLELFAGAGGMSLGLECAGFVPVAHAEIADAPRAVLAHRWPTVPLYGDVTTIDGAEVAAAHGAVDIVTFGAPCQDLSVAGKRAGLAGARSSLFFHGIRLWHETDARFALYENVCGALSSNAGADFAAVLGAFVGGDVPLPVNKRGKRITWPRAGRVLGPAGVAAWRVLDAQWFGVPQRRARVFVLGTRAGSLDPAQVLLEPEGVRWHPAPRRETGEGSAARAGAGAAGAGGRYGVNARGVDLSYQRPLPDECSEDYWARMERHEREHGISPDMLAVPLAFSWQQGGDHTTSMRLTPESPSLVRGNVPAVLAFHHTQDPISGPVAPSLVQPSDGMGVLAFQSSQSGVRAGDTFPTLDGNYGSRRHNGVVTIGGEVAHALTHEGHDASEDGTGRGVPIVARCVTTGEGGRLDSETCTFPIEAGIPRRLTPRECERLMGWPDDWTLVPDARGKLLSDAARYKACGNGVVSHVAQWIGERLLLGEMGVLG